MELVEGETLESLIAAGPMTPDRAAGIVRQIATALETAHAGGVVHRDIKPGNVVVRRDGLVKVLDFGIARVPRDSGGSVSQSSGGAPAASGLQGTPAYISPEAGFRHSFLSFGEISLFAWFASTWIGWPPNSLVRNEYVDASFVSNPTARRVWLKSITGRRIHNYEMQIGPLSCRCFASQWIGYVWPSFVIVGILKV